MKAKKEARRKKRNADEWKEKGETGRRVGVSDSNRQMWRRENKGERRVRREKERCGRRKNAFVRIKKQRKEKKRKEKKRKEKKRKEKRKEKEDLEKARSYHLDCSYFVLPPP